ncbi:ceroid-lipofuscinosis neuronal protein 5-like [Corticium candelabrum]|uniref:ceroid-lipofuscinosis neuronal protein 5-like n=1 Tax=Corticium candelabrum TaxID=121492 RepID=UPI002E275346|nr:ceroid-lipofuscinosis neuronal protein 5-like [Corticium candelabrum]
MHDDDVIDIYSLQAPVWEFVTGDLMAHFNIYHDALGFRSRKTGLNYTLEWYELFELFNCTFPHILENDSYPLWCNQGATCLYDGIDDVHWTANGTLMLIGEMTGAVFNKFASYLKWDNETAIYYITFHVASQPDNGTLYWASWDCTTFVIHAIEEMAKLGAEFNHSRSVNYTKMTLYSDTPVLLGNASEIFGPNGNATLADDMMKFYADFQTHQSIIHWIEHILDAALQIFVEDKFYFWYNEQYWFLPMKAPYFKLTFNTVPFP